jgi:hypothetical protein
LVTKLSMAQVRWARSRSKSHCVGCAEKSSGEDAEFRRMGLSLPKTSGFMSWPMTTKGCTFGVDDAGRHLKWHRPILYRDLEFGGGERKPCLQHVYGATHTDHGQHTQYLRA